VAELPDRFARVVAANTGLTDGSGVPDDAGPAMRALYESLPVLTMTEVIEKFHSNDGAPGFFYWRKYCAEVPELRIRDIMGTAPYPDDVLAAYEAPFPDQRYVAGARSFPGLVPIFPDDPAIPDNRRAWESLRMFDRPFLTAFSDGDPVTRGREKRLQEEIVGARGQNHMTIRGAGHFLQEEKGEELADVVNQFIADTGG
jgi:haloalkane dehalogenase